MTLFLSPQGKGYPSGPPTNYGGPPGPGGAPPMYNGPGGPGVPPNSYPNAPGYPNSTQGMAPMTSNTGTYATAAGSNGPPPPVPLNPPSSNPSSNGPSASSKPSSPITSSSSANNANPPPPTGPDGVPIHDETSQQSTLSQSSDRSDGTTGGRQTPKASFMPGQGGYPHHGGPGSPHRSAPSPGLDGGYGSGGSSGWQAQHRMAPSPAGQAPGGPPPPHSVSDISWIVKCCLSLFILFRLFLHFIPLRL